MPADDATFLPAARAIVAPLAARRQFLPSQSLFTTLNRDDALSAGFEHAEELLGEDGGFSVEFDGSGVVPSVELVLMDGRITGYHAIREARRALEVAEAMAARMTGRA